MTTNELEATTVDKKTMKKRAKHFLKKQKSGSATPMKPESKLMKIQKSMALKHHQQYKSVPVVEVVCLDLLFSLSINISQKSLVSQ